MKYYRFLLIVLLGGALVPLFFIQNKQGEPMLSIPSLTLPSLSSGTDTLSSIPTSPEHQQFYKWKDAKGQWHYGDKPPTNTPYKTININIQTNIIQHTPIPKQETAQASTSVQPAPPKPAYTPPKDDKDALTIDRALHIINDAKSVRNQMNERNKQLEQLSQ
jgi:hypothetical protein